MIRIHKKDTKERKKKLFLHAKLPRNSNVIGEKMVQIYVMMWCIFRYKWNT